jgi:hypothetical protein
MNFMPLQACRPTHRPTFRACVRRLIENIYGVHIEVRQLEFYIMFLLTWVTVL